MAQLITGSISVSYKVNETLVYGGASPNNPPVQNLINPVLSYVNGNSAVAGAINLHVEAETTPITLAAGASQTFTLSALTDGLGRTFSMAGGVRLLLITALTRTAGDFLTFKPGTTNGWTAILSGTSPVLKFFDLLALAIGQTDKYPITAGSNDQFTITNGGSNPITFAIGIGGCDS